MSTDVFYRNWTFKGDDWECQVTHERVAQGPFLVRAQDGTFMREQGKWWVKDCAVLDPLRPKVMTTMPVPESEVPTDIRTMALLLT